MFFVASYGPSIDCTLGLSVKIALPGGPIVNLDLGCGNVPSQAVGIDVNFESLRRRGGLSVCARGESLPFTSNCFDQISSMVAIPYMHLNDTLRECFRVLKSNGTATLKVHPWTFAVGEVFRAIQDREPKNFIFRLFVLSNGLLLHVLGRQFTIGNRCETFQTQRALRRSGMAAGFQQVYFRWDTSIEGRHAGRCYVEFHKPSAKIHEE